MSWSHRGHKQMTNSRPRKRHAARRGTSPHLLRKSRDGRGIAEGAFAPVPISDREVVADSVQ